MIPRFLRILVTLSAMVLAIVAIYRLEVARVGVDITHAQLGGTPVTFYRAHGSQESLVLISHGFAGSRQMMEAISLTLARAGHTVVAFDYYGHGRHGTPLSPSIDTLTGTTEDLVQQTERIARQARAETGLERIALVGHSMATDVIVRAAQRLDQVAGVVAISMYSDAVTADHPARLLVISGAQEQRLRDVALDAVVQIGPRQEGMTVRRRDLARRAVAAPWVGHVGVLWSPATTFEIAAWLGPASPPVRTGPWIAVLLGAIVVLFRLLVPALPAARAPRPPSLRRAIVAATLPALAAGLVALTGLPLIGLAGFGGLGLAFGVWGALALAVLRPSFTPRARDAVAALLLVGWGIGAFALALDRYGAAFVPTGPRLPLTVFLLPATLLFALADRALVQGRAIVARILLRVPFPALLLVAMFAQPSGLGLLFTVVPVLVLFFVVYGTMAGWVARRAGPLGAGIGSGVILAWAIAASTPLFVG